jgi:hypothetical protein
MLLAPSFHAFSQQEDLPRSFFPFFFSDKDFVTAKKAKGLDTVT